MAKGREATAGSGADAETKSGSGDPGPEVEAQVSAPVASPAPPLIDLDFVKGLIEAVDGSGIDSLEITRAGTRVKIAKTPPSAGGGPAFYAPAAQPAPAAAAPASAAPAAPAAGGAPAGEAAAPAQEEASSPAQAKGVEIKSPMVGTFYRAPAPDAPPYVEVGTRVSKGQTLCIIEAMKLMNELESEADGVITETLVENAEPVEFGQVLFRIDPNG